MIASKECMLVFIGVLVLSMKFVENASATRIIKQKPLCYNQRNSRVEEPYDGDNYVRRYKKTNPCRPLHYDHYRNQGDHHEARHYRVIYGSTNIRRDKHIVNPEPYNI